MLDHNSQHWTDDVVTAKQATDLYHLVQQIDSIDPGRYDETTITVNLHPDAAKLWKQFYNENADQVNGAAGLAAGMGQKLANHVLRFALILHVPWFPEDPRVMVPADTMQAAITLAKWWRGHLARYVHLAGGEASPRDDVITRRILRILRTVDADPAGWVTYIKVLQWLGNVPTAMARATLAALAMAGRVEQRTDQSGTKPGTSWRIAPVHDLKNSTYSKNSRNSAGEPATEGDSSNTSNGALDPNAPPAQRQQAVVGPNGAAHDEPVDTETFVISLFG